MRITRERLSERDGWTVDVAIVPELAAATDLVRRLSGAGFDADVDPLERPPDDRARGRLGYRVRSGLFAVRADADAQAAAVRAAGLPVRGPVFTAEDGGPTTGPWVVHVLTVAPARYLGRVVPVLANDVVADRELLSSLSRRHGALAAVNGGYFVIGGSVLTGTGDGADWLRGHARPGTRMTVQTKVSGQRGRLDLTRGLGVVNGGPRLPRDGRPAITAGAEGFDDVNDPAFYYAFALRRNPRAIAGVTRDGRLMLVAVDDRAPGHSAGLSFEEEAAVMRALGARDAVNLDGGGSTTMTVRGNAVTQPSDATGERPIGDAILLD